MTTKENGLLTDTIWICPSGNKVYSTDEGNSTPELKYIRAQPPHNGVEMTEDQLKKLKREVYGILEGMDEVERFLANLVIDHLNERGYLTAQKEGG